MPNQTRTRRMSQFLGSKPSSRLIHRARRRMHRVAATPSLHQHFLSPREKTKNRGVNLGSALDSMHPKRPVQRHESTDEALFAYQPSVVRVSLLF